MAQEGERRLAVACTQGSGGYVWSGQSDVVIGHFVTVCAGVVDRNTKGATAAVWASLVFCGEELSQFSCPFHA
jgi:hypothetical protein